MTTDNEEYNTAIRALWAGRDLQAQKQEESGKRDAGDRGSVTGGQHFDPLQELIASQFGELVDHGVKVRVRGGKTLPGYYRRSKNWDIVVTHESKLLAAIECKSMAGSVGNNWNNRAEEVIGNAVDLRRAYEAGLVGDIPPWICSVFVFRHEINSNRPVGNQGNPVYPIDKEFKDSSYTTRYRILFQRLVRDGIYDTACFITSVKGKGIYDEPVPELSTGSLTTEIAKRIEQIKKIIKE